jgi:hypothetical protein
MGERVEEFNKWLKENYPNEANKLEELQKKDPELYQRQWRLIAGKYWRIFEVSKENPELARILKEQIELNDTQERLVRQLRRADNEQEKEKLIGQLKDVLNKKYDLIVAQKKIAYEMLRKRLENLQKHVEESQTNVEKWQKPEFKKQQVEERLKDLVGTSDKFEWD